MNNDLIELSFTNQNRADLCELNGFAGKPIAIFDCYRKKAKKRKIIVGKLVSAFYNQHISRNIHSDDYKILSSLDIKIQNSENDKETQLYYLNDTLKTLGKQKSDEFIPSADYCAFSYYVNTFIIPVKTTPSLIKIATTEHEFMKQLGECSIMGITKVILPYEDSENLNNFLKNSKEQFWQTLKKS